MARAVAATVLIVAIGVLENAAGICDYGTLPGYWDGQRYETLGEACRLRRLVDEWRRESPAADVGDARRSGGGDLLLLIGDSFDRQTVQAAAKAAGVAAVDYTPFAADADGKPSKIGRNLVAPALGGDRLANLFIFGANNEGRYPAEPTAAGLAEGMHGLTYDRICEDFRRHSKGATVRPQPALFSWRPFAAVLPS